MRTQLLSQAMRWGGMRGDTLWVGWETQLSNPGVWLPLTSSSGMDTGCEGRQETHLIFMVKGFNSCFCSSVIRGTSVFKVKKQSKMLVDLLWPWLTTVCHPGGRYTPQQTVTYHVPETSIGGWPTWEARIKLHLKEENFFFFLLFRAAPSAHGGSQVRGPIRAAAASLHHSHSNAGSEPGLQPTPHLTATLDPKPPEWGQGSNSQPRGSSSDLFPLCYNGNAIKWDFKLCFLLTFLFNNAQQVSSWECEAH